MNAKLHDPEDTPDKHHFTLGIIDNVQATVREVDYSIRLSVLDMGQPDQEPYSNGIAEGNTKPP